MRLPLKTWIVEFQFCSTVVKNKESLLLKYQTMKMRMKVKNLPVSNFVNNLHDPFYIIFSSTTSLCSYGTRHHYILLWPVGSQRILFWINRSFLWFIRIYPLKQHSRQYTVRLLFSRYFEVNKLTAANSKKLPSSNPHKKTLWAKHEQAKFTMKRFPMVFRRGANHCGQFRSFLLHRYSRFECFQIPKYSDAAVV